MNPMGATYESSKGNRTNPLEEAGDRSPCCRRGQLSFVHFAELELLNLSRRRQRERVDDANELRHLEPRESFAAKGLNLIGVDGRAGFQPQCRRDFFAEE